ncbi:putative nucleotidyltransferase, ribonuclease H [Tanacetum coccineum]
MESVMIGGITSKGQGNPSRTTEGDRKVETARSFEQPPRMLGSKRSRDMSKYCYFHEDHGHDTNDFRQLRSQIKEAVKSGQLSHLLKGIKKERAKTSDSQRGEKKEKSTTSAEAPILMINQEEACTKNSTSKIPTFEGREITFPLVTKGSNSSAPVVIKARIFRREVGRIHMDSGSLCEGKSPRPLEKKDSNAENGDGSLHDPRGRQIPYHPRNRNCVLNTQIQQNRRSRQQQVPRTDSHHQKAAARTLQRKVTKPLRTNADVFAWTHVDMKGIPRTITVDGKPFNTEHKLNEYSHIKPIKQKRRSLGPDRSTTSCKEVEELTRAGILREAAHQTWVANLVMVKKSDGGWRMCIDFMDINKACPKDCYPLPEIDWKTAFFTGEGVNCYRKMPFGLKNARATYQRLVDKVFNEQIGRNLEAYIDDMVIKSTSEENMLTDIKETPQRFRSINMKLNPKKCSFDIEEGSFLGHLVTKQGIQANPLKVKAIADTEQPKMLKDIQSLNGKLAALSQFLSKGAERSLPFFKVLKSCTDKKNIQWTKEAAGTLQEMKKLVETLPTLTALIVTPPNYDTQRNTTYPI